MSTFAPTFEIVPFGWELERGRTAGTSSSRGMRSRPIQRPPSGPYRPPWRRRRDALGGSLYAWGADGTEPPEADEPAPPASSEYVRWVQDTLNRALGSSLTVDGVMTRSLRRWIRVFQRRNRLPVSGYIGPDTDAALRHAARDGQLGESELEWELSGDALTADNALSAARAVPVESASQSLGRTKVAGLYRFHAPDGRFYTGMTIDLRRRLQAHSWCLSHLGKSAGNYRVALYPMPDATPQRVRSLERAINAHYLKNDRTRLLNRRTELEVLELGEI